MFVCVWYFSLVVWYLVPFLCTLLCEFEIVHTSVHCVLEFFAAADIWWCSFCSLKHYCSVRVLCGGLGLMTICNSGFVFSGNCSGISLSSK